MVSNSLGALCVCDHTFWWSNDTMQILDEVLENVLKSCIFGGINKLYNVNKIGCL